jgi:hypothetical protein
MQSRPLRQQPYPSLKEKPMALLRAQPTDAPNKLSASVHTKDLTESARWFRAEALGLYAVRYHADAFWPHTAALERASHRLRYRDNAI